MKVALSCPSVRYYSIETRSEAFTSADETEAKLLAKEDFIRQQYRIRDVLTGLYACLGECLMKVAYASTGDVALRDDEYVSAPLGTTPEKYKVHVLAKRPFVVACLDPEAFPTGHPGDEGKIDTHLAQLVKAAADGKDADGKPLIIETGRPLSCPGEQELTIEVLSSGSSRESAADARAAWRRNFSADKRAFEQTIERFFSCEQVEGGSKCAARPLVTKIAEGPVTLKDYQYEDTSNGQKALRWLAVATVEVTFLVKCNPK